MNVSFSLKTSGFTGSTQRLNRIKNYFSRKKFVRRPMTKAGKLSVDIIRKRTARGLNIDSRPFPKLEFEYAKRKLREIGNAEPNLIFSGKMMRNMRSWTSRDRGAKITIGFNRRQSIKAEALQNGNVTIDGDGLPPRPFLGLGKADKIRVREFLSNAINLEVRKINK